METSTVVALVVAVVLIGGGIYLYSQAPAGGVPVLANQAPAGGGGEAASIISASGGAVSAILGGIGGLYSNVGRSTSGAAAGAVK